jgi:hypothetical protein
MGDPFMAMVAAQQARRPSGKERACLRVALFQASVIAIKMRLGAGRSDISSGLGGREKRRLAGDPEGSRPLGAAGRAGTAHVVQLRAVGVEHLGEERVEESTHSGEGMALSDTALRRGGKGNRTDDRHDVSCLFSRVF